MSFNKFVLLLVWGAVFLISILCLEKLIELDYNAFLIPFLHPIIFFLTVNKILKDFLYDKIWFTLENIHLFFLYVMLGFGSISYILFLENDLSTPFHFTPTIVNKSISLVMIGIVAYRVTHYFLKFNLSYKLNFTKINFKPLYLIFSITIFFKFLLFKLGGSAYGASMISESSTNLSPIFSYISYLSHMNLIVLIIMSFYFFSGKSQFFSKKIYYFFVGLSFFISLSTGYKEDLLDVLFAILIPYSFLQITKDSSFKIDKKYFILTITLLLIFTMVFPIFRYFYFIVRFSPYSAFDLLMSMDKDSFLGVYSAIGSNEGTSFATAGLITLLKRFTTFEYLCAAVQFTPDIYPFLNFEKYSSIFIYSFIPRIFWENKPIHFSGIDFTFNYKSGAGLVTEATNPTIIGWGYLELGIIGVVLVMMILALISSIINYWMIAGKGNSLLKIIFSSFLFMHFFSIENDLFYSISTAFVQMVIIIIFLLLYFLLNAIFSKKLKFSLK